LSSPSYSSYGDAHDAQNRRNALVFGVDTPAAPRASRGAAFATPSKPVLHFGFIRCASRSRIDFIARIMHNSVL